MKLIIDIPEEMYKNIKSGLWCGNNIISNAIEIGTPIPDNATVCDIEQIRAEIEHEADYQDAYIDADVAKGLYMALELIDKHK